MKQNHNSLAVGIAMAMWAITALTFPPLAHAQTISFDWSVLQGTFNGNPTSLQFGPDNRLYVLQKVGKVKTYEVVQNGPQDWAVADTEIVSDVLLLQTHDDDGSVNNDGSLDDRQATGLVVTGNATNPVMYVSSSDPRVGGSGGTDNDLNLDTNSGVITRMSWVGATRDDPNGTWESLDIVRGLPRSEENHATNGLTLSLTGDTLFVAQGGNTNAGSPSVKLAYLTEYALAAAILAIDLPAIDALPTQVDPVSGRNYKYDIPTLDDPTRPNVNGITDPGDLGYDGIDEGDPWGGNDGLNQAMVVAGGPVSIYAAGFRNHYDLVVTKTDGRAGRIYTIDNGANGSFGGHPVGEGPGGTCTNDYDPAEPGSQGPGPNDGQVNNLDGLHVIVGPGYYGGHPAPVRANPNGAGLYTYDSGVGVFRTSTTDPTNPLPANWPPVPPAMADAQQCDFQNPGVSDQSLHTWDESTNGIVEYRATNFLGAMEGDLLAVSFDGSLHRIQLNAIGDAVISVDTLVSGFGIVPLDVWAIDDNGPFPGTIWAAIYIGNSIVVFEPDETLLAVEVVGLTGSVDGNDVKIAWSAASGADNTGWSVEQRTSDSFRERGFVPSRRGEDEQIAYTFTHTDVAVGTHSYRLKHIDESGAASYSDEVEVTVEPLERIVVSEVYPNPFASQAAIEVVSRAAEDLTVEVFDLLGRRVSILYDGSTTAGETLVMTLGATGLPNGVYAVRILARDFVATRLAVLGR